MSPTTAPAPREAGDLSALGPWAKELAQTFVSLASDIALVVDAGGVIRDVAQRGGEPMAPGASHWVGRAWADTVTGDTRRKIELLLQEVATTGVARRREVNHPTGGGGIPVAYTAIRLGPQGPVLAVGRDLRAIAAIQQRFLDTQQELERGYWKARQAESRERELVGVATDAVLVVDAASGEVVAGNAAARALFGAALEPGAGTTAGALFDDHSRGAVAELLRSARGSGRPAEIRARLAARPTTVGVAATPFRSGELQRLLVRVRASESTGRGPQGGTREAVCIVDSNARVLSCSPAFASLTASQDEASLQGRSLGDWLGRDAAEVVALTGQARREGVVACERSAWRRADARPPAAVAVEATLLTEGDQEAFGIVLRPVDVDLRAPAALHEALAHVLAVLGDRLGQAPLATLLQQTTAAAERHLIDAAMGRSGGDVEAAARLLGISRATLVRRRRRAHAGGGGAS